MVLGHEIGHHVCGHTLGMMQSDAWAKELEADRYAGSAIRRSGHTSMQEVFEVARQLHSVQGSPTHPPLHMRLARAVARP
jgi:hypothetical protein